MAFEESGGAREQHYLHLEGREQLTVAGRGGCGPL